MIKNYFAFSGRLTRAELFQGFMGMCATGMLLGLVTSLGNSGALFAACFIPMMGMLGILLPLWISMRLRDAGYSPYWAILCILPPFMVIGGIVSILLPTHSAPES